MIDIEVSRWEEEGGAAQPEQREVFRGVLALMEQREVSDKPRFVGQDGDAARRTVELPIVDPETQIVTGMFSVDADGWLAQLALPDLQVGELISNTDCPAARRGRRCALRRGSHHEHVALDDAGGHVVERWSGDDPAVARTSDTLDLDQRTATEAP